MRLIAEDASVVRVPNLPQDGEDHRGPNIGVEADQSRNIPEKVDGGGSLQPQRKPNLGGLRAEDEDVKGIF